MDTKVVPIYLEGKTMPVYQLVVSKNNPLNKLKINQDGTVEEDK